MRRGWPGNQALRIEEGDGRCSSALPPLPRKYRLQRLIGVGGMGAVYEAEHTLIGRRVAIKALRPELVGNAAMLERFQQEAKAAGRLVSDHVVPVIDYGVASDGTPFIVMELLGGETLAALLARKQRLQPSHAVDLVVQACRGVQRAHEAGIVHCDLKPRNLMLVRREDGTRHVKVLDFGVARLVENTASRGGAASGVVLGTPSYMSPEQASGDECVDARSDVYALGVILYQLLSGALPHPGFDPVAVRARVARDAPIRLDSIRPDLSSRLVDVVHTALEHCPQDRFQSAEELAHALAEFVGHADEGVFETGSPIDETGVLGPQTAECLVTGAGTVATEPTRGAPAVAPTGPRRTSGTRSASAFVAGFAALLGVGAALIWWMEPPVGIAEMAARPPSTRVRVPSTSDQSLGMDSSCARTTSAVGVPSACATTQRSQRPGVAVPSGEKGRNEVGREPPSIRPETAARGSGASPRRFPVPVRAQRERADSVGGEAPAASVAQPAVSRDSPAPPPSPLVVQLDRTSPF